MLTEFTTPGPALTVDDDATIYSLLTTRLETSAENAPLAQNKEADGSWSTMTAVEFNDHVRAIAKGLIQFGIGKGDAVSIFSATRIEWGLLDFALAAIGAVSVPIYDTDSAAQAQRILNDSAVKLAIADNQERFDRLDSVLDSCHALERILMLDAHAINALEGLGVMISDEELDERIGSVHADDLATIVYTSGSTGAPKGAELTHRNFTSITRAAQNCLPGVITGEARLLLFLPLAHCFARMIQYFAIGSAEGVVGYLPNTKTLPRDMQVFQPTFLLGVPRVFEKVYNAASRKAGTGWKGRMFAKAAEAAIEWSTMQQAGERPSAKQRAEHAMYETSVYRTIRSAFGPRIKYLASGGAPITLDLLHFFNGIGLTMIQGYGLTETAAPFTFTRVTDNKIGTVGQPVPGASVRIASSGELEVRGQNVFVGYHHLPEKTAEVVTEDGWLRTGDLASIDDEGHITLTGRAKDIIITAGGKNVAPIPMEQEIAKCPIVEHAVVVGDNRPFVAAVVTLDPEGLAQWLPTQKLAADLSLEEAAALPEVHAEIQRYVDRANADVSRAESVRKFIVLPVQFTQDNKCLTPSMKVVRPKVNDVFAREIDKEIYGR
ncbi:AMP-dependent synthetase/ligase [Bifidobacterium pseudolongum]|uniref:Acyl-CoA synthetase n=1 Tax=Bifidobacterium pseudolongum subsp. globosum TaxID=1690 RepID=A0A2N3QZD2_9BIFI|nr:AMP-dependent synthetase/ligase [Bifidobacterium pseudolongum]PKU98763.1 AMP-binding protein [Bifidobacterium pseudolongum subsp. globosum]PKV02870.1 AMP-binding protein [Bifidobacterium pseudolongum subsp. globosum]RYQ73196.1 AMP-binding protein [Bifidobacterium pseudolongum subsp. globosum]RYQ74270.1 AMP-binding protein [Bifidobacterium pseudolongum subsp. globosum]